MRTAAPYPVRAGAPIHSRTGGKWAVDKSGGGRNYLYQLPWYMFIGAPGSGKTTALLNSGLRFPLEGKMGKDAVKGTLKVLPAKTPRRMDLVITTPDGKEIAIPAIYKLEGDTLTICEAPGRRPADFSGGRDGERLLILKRAKPRP